LRNGKGTFYFKGEHKSSRIEGWWTNGRLEGVCYPYSRKGRMQKPMIYNDGEPIMTRVLLAEKLENCVIF
jgi:hypothetical protein